jgi:uncharacterized membrane protein YdcZ (DUF606 family)
MAKFGLLVGQLIAGVVCGHQGSHHQNAGLSGSGQVGDGTMGIGNK